MDLKTIQPNLDEKIKDDLKIFIKNMKNITEYQVILGTIIETHLQKDNDDIFVRNLTQHLSEVFNANAFSLIAYLQFPKVYNLNELNLDAKYKKALDCINKLKLKYGFVIRDLFMKSQSPLLITSIDVSVNIGNSLHNLKVIRGDGNALNGFCNSEMLMSFITRLLASLQASMEQGVYNFSDVTVKNFLTQNKHFEEYFVKLIKESDPETQAAIALDEDV